METIETQLKFCGQRILLESTGDKQIDADLRQLFYDDYQKSGPLEMTRPDVQRVLTWIEEKQIESGLFENQTRDG